MKINAVIAAESGPAQETLTMGYGSVEYAFDAGGYLKTARNIAAKVGALIGGAKFQAPKRVYASVKSMTKDEKKWPDYYVPWAESQEERGQEPNSRYILLFKASDKSVMSLTLGRDKRHGRRWILTVIVRPQGDEAKDLQVIAGWAMPTRTGNEVGPIKMATGWDDKIAGIMSGEITKRIHIA